MRRRSRISLSVGVGAVLVVMTWLIFAPSQLGGATSYVIVDGNSMEPKFHKGDLVLVRPADNYQIGDIVTYRHPDIGPVIHRIIGRDGSRYVFQGDNNSFVDGYQPEENELIGKKWVHIPSVGTWLTGARGPRNMAILVGLVGVIVMSSFISVEQKTREPVESETPGPTLAGEVVRFAAVVAFAAALVAAVSFSRPTHVTAKSDVPYNQQVAFRYDAAALGGDRIYDGGAASAGEPVFRQVSDSVDVGFHYSATSDDATDLSGTWRLLAEVSDVNGWRRTIELLPETAFQGSEVDGSATLKFADIQGMLDDVAQRTSVSRNQYDVTIVPEVHLKGTIGGVAVDDTFAPGLEFLFDNLQLQMANAQDPTGSLAPSKGGTVTKETQVGNTISVLAWKIDVGTTRMVSIAVLGICVVVGLLALLAGAATRGGGKPETPERETIEVRAWADLMALSKRLRTPVQSEIRGRYRRYYVEGSDLTWQFFEIIAHGESAQ